MICVILHAVNPLFTNSHFAYYFTSFISMIKIKINAKIMNFWIINNNVSFANICLKHTIFTQNFAWVDYRDINIKKINSFANDVEN